MEEILSNIADGQSVLRVCRAASRLASEREPTQSGFRQ